mmetsp:Transcript_14525/g.29117  ORF Transcript_14525/g.29117 Transcript_14525/m.29117 type:complete len:194 (-) Transcript_14525:387-968(-)
MVDLTKWLVSGAAFATLCWRRDIESMLCILGAILNALVAKILKRIFNAARPQGARLSDPGMPSSHAQSLFFFASFLALAVDERALLSVISAELAPSVRLVLPPLLFGLAGFLSQLRVRAGLHTVEQVGVGACFGTSIGALWHTAQPRILSAVNPHVDGRQHIAVLVVVGALVVGSVERFIGKMLKRRGSRRAE